MTFLVGELLSWNRAFIGVAVQAAIAYRDLDKQISEYSDRALRAETARLAEQYQHVLYDRAFDVAAHLAGLIRVDNPFEPRTMKTNGVGFERLKARLEAAEESDHTPSDSESSDSE